MKQHKMEQYLFWHVCCAHGMKEVNLFCWTSAEVNKKWFDLKLKYRVLVSAAGGGQTTSSIPAINEKIASTEEVEPTHIYIFNDIALCSCYRW